MGLFSRKPSGKAFLEAVETRYLTVLAGELPRDKDPQSLVEAHDYAFAATYDMALGLGVTTDWDYMEIVLLKTAAQKYGLDQQEAVDLFKTFKNNPEMRRISNTPTKRKVVLTSDGRGVLIHGRNPADPTSSWKYRVDPGIDLYHFEHIVFKEVNHMDIDLGLPITWPLYKEDADEYALSPDEYRRKREKNSSND